MKCSYFIFALFNFTSCSNNITSIEEKQDTIVKMSDSVTLSHTIDGNGDTTLLFLHGWAINKTYWDSQVKFFSSKYKVVAVDLAGFGQSDTTRNDFHFERYAQDVSELITQLQLKNVVLIGHSMSGDIIVETAINYPQGIIGLVGIDNFNGVGKPFTKSEKKEVDAFISQLDSAYISSIKGYAESFLFHRSTDTLVRERIKNDMASVNQRVAINSFRNLMIYLQKESEKLPKLKLRLNLLNSDANPTDTVELAKLAGASYQVYPINATGHYPMIEKPREFIVILQQILDDMGRP